MPANVQPRFTGLADFQGSVTITTANTTKDGTGTTPSLIYTAPTDGALVTGIWAAPLGTNVQTVARVFLNNGAALTTATNNIKIAEWTLPAVTLSETTAIPHLWIPIPRPFSDVKATHRLYVAIGTTVAAGWMFSAAASKFATT